MCTQSQSDMEIIPEGRNFRLAHDDELPYILNIVEKHLPYSLKFHQTIRTYLNHRVWQFYFYVSKNWPEKEVCLHFPGCTLTPNNFIYESFGFFCPVDDLDGVELIQTENVLFDWSVRKMYLNYTHVKIVDHMEVFLKTIGDVERIQGDVFVCNPDVFDDTEDCMELGELPSNEVEMRLLRSEDVKGIHDLYPASEIESIEVFEKLAENMPGYGIFTLDGEIAAWMVQSYYGAMFSMQTKPAFRRKGYGIYLAKHLSRLVIKRGYKPFVLIRHENDASQSLYKKLGFENQFQMARIVFTPFNCNDENGKKFSEGVNGALTGQSNGKHVSGQSRNGANNHKL